VSTRFRLFAAGLAATVLAAGCSGSDGAVARPTAATTPASTTASTTAATPPAALARPGPASVSKLPSSLVGKEWDRLPTSSRVVALTFDACGNDAGVESILSTLAAKNVRATFFVCGRWVESFPAEARAIASRYPVGNHTYRPS
jgi:peptidoglycan/xylan/chitin deacetylase (PgdA/CDA1 family)